MLQGFCTSLELLPMWSGVEPDVELFASGRVLDDDGEWAGGQALDQAAGAPLRQACCQQTPGTCPLCRRAVSAGNKHNFLLDILSLCCFVLW